VDGVVLPPDRAVISVYDRGFLYGDGAFEVLRTYGGRAARLDRPPPRLARPPAPLRGPPRDLDVVGAPPPPAPAAPRPPPPAGTPESYIGIMVSRGEGKLGLMIDPGSRVPRVVLVEPLRPVPQDLYDRGARAITIRVSRPHANAKLLPYITSILALDDARAAF